MIIREQRRDAAIERMADHLLAVGMAGASLRSLAKAARVSDRMLLYYFSNKDELLGLTLERIAGRLTDALDHVLPAGRKLPPDKLLTTVWSAMSSQTVRPYMRLWLELAARDDAANAVAGSIVDGFMAWLESHLMLPPGEDRKSRAAAILAMVDGLMLLNAVGRKALADKAIRARTKSD